MGKKTVSAVIERVKRMEECFDLLREAFLQDPAVRQELWFRELLRLLRDYYEGGLWRGDYELDEKGLLPQELKRGILSQDAVYDFLEQTDLPAGERGQADDASLSS